MTHSVRRGFTTALGWFTALLLSVLLAACGGGGDGGGGSVTGTGTLGVSLTDSPSCGFDKVNVTVVKVRVHQSSSAPDSDAGWTDITLSPARKIDLLSLNNGVLFNLGEATLPAGHYTQLRLVLDPNTATTLVNSVVPTGGVETALVTPSAVQSGIKLVNQFDVAVGERVDLVLDFDACKSIVTRGNGTYALKPVIKVVPFVPNGIKGFVDLALLNSSVLVTAQQSGVIIQTTAPTTTGEFFLARLAAGNYDVVLTANGRATAVIAAVPVASTTTIVTLSSTGTPITMPVSLERTISGTATLNPVSSTEAAYVAARQTFGPAPVVTVKSVAADELSTVPGPGAYSLTLPYEAPVFGQYGTGTLPIALVAQPLVAGKYTAAASATGYTTQSISADIDVANATRNFVLVP